MTRVGQRTEKRRTIYSPPLNRGHSWWEPHPRGERRWEDGWRRAKQRSPKKILKSPTHTPYQPCRILLQLKASLALRPTGQRWLVWSLGSGPALEQNTAHWALAVFLICCWCVGWGLGLGGESDTWILVCSLLETNSFVLNFIWSED